MLFIFRSKFTNIVMVQSLRDMLNQQYVVLTLFERIRPQPNLKLTRWHGVDCVKMSTAMCGISHPSIARSTPHPAYTLYKLYAVPVRICITPESYHQYPL